MTPFPGRPFPDRKTNSTNTRPRQLQSGVRGRRCQTYPKPNLTGCCFRINPLFAETQQKRPKVVRGAKKQRHSHSPTGDKSNSSGYGGSHDSCAGNDLLARLREDASSVSDETADSVRATAKGAGPALTTIPEGRVDASIPRPIWPRSDGDGCYDSLVDEALLLYTNNNNNNNVDDPVVADMSIKEVLIDVSNCITAAMGESNELLLQPLLVKMKQRVAVALEVLKISREEEMRALCVNLSNGRKLRSVVRACSNTSSSSSGGSESSDGVGAPESGSARLRRLNSEPEDGYRAPSAFSGGCREEPTYAEPKVQEERGEAKRNLLKAVDDKPSVWEYYYGVRIVPEKGRVPHVAKPTDVPLYVSRHGIFWWRFYK